jgi:hypothetical protein
MSTCTRTMRFCALVVITHRFYTRRGCTSSFVLRMPHDRVERGHQKDADQQARIGRVPVSSADRSRPQMTH